MGMGGVQRVYSIPKVLKELGWDVDIQTAYPPYSYIKDKESFKLDNLNIIRSFSPDPLHILPGKLSTPGAGKRDYLSFPDNKIYWLPFLWRKIKKPDIIVISCPPFSLAFTLFLTKNTPAVIDYRDLWTGSHLGKYLLKAEENLAKKIEEKFTNKASAVVTVTQKIGDYLKKEYPLNKNKIHLIRNGFDEKSFPNQIKKQKRKEIILTYMGTFNEFEEPDLIFEGLKRLTEISPTLGRKTFFKHIGYSRKKDMKRIANTIGFKRFISLGYKPHREALYEMVNSDILLLTGGKGADSKWHIPGKTYEYLRSGIPIIAISNNNELKTIIGSGGLVVDFDKEAIARAIIKIIQKPESFKPLLNYKKYEWENLAKQYSELLSSLL